MTRTADTLRTRRRRAFSLIELLITVAIIAALVGVAGPMFGSYVAEAQASKVRQDLDLITGAIRRFQHEKGVPLTGSSLAALEGGQLQEIPVDPWGNDYFFDGNLGVVGSFGSDGIQGGESTDADLYVQYSKYLTPLKASFRKGGLGRVAAGDVLEVRLSKPVSVSTDEVDSVPHELALVMPHEGAYPFSLWWLGFRYDTAESMPAQGILIFDCVNPPPPALNPSFPTGTMVVFPGLVTVLSENPSPAGETALFDPTPYMWGAASAVGADGYWAGARVEG